MWTMSSGSPLAGTRKLQRRTSASQIFLLEGGLFGYALA
jgi:hypothetical protein